MNTAAKQRNPLSWSLAGALVFFVLLWLLDFPKPMTDDLFYCGASLNLASGGDFSNPLLVRQEFPSHFFFVYPPVHPHVLTGWLTIFGTSAATMTAFQMLMYFITAAATIFLLRRQAAPVWLEWLVPLGISSAFLNIGLRPEPLAVALTMAGFALSESHDRRKILNAGGFFLMALGAGAAPRVTPFAFLLIVLAGYRCWKCPVSPRPRRWTWFWLGFPACLLAAAVCLWMIDFRALEFLKTFQVHASRVTGGKFELLSRFLFTFMGITQLPLFLSLLVFVLLSLRQRGNELSRMGLLLVATFFVVPLIGGLGHGSIWFAILALFALAAPLAMIATRSQIVVLQTALWLILLLANSKTLIGVAGIAIGRIRPDVEPQKTAALELHPSPEHPLLLDPATARYIFDYRIPTGAIDWNFAAPFPGELVTDTKLRPEDIFLIGPASVETLRQKGYLNLPTPKWVPLGRQRWAYDEYPRRAYIIRAGDCKSPPKPSGRE